MRIVTKSIFFSFIILLFLNGCSSSNYVSDQGIFQYKDSYIGDNSAVGNILNRLPCNGQMEQFSLETNEKPYGMAVQYKDSEPPMTEEEIKETIIYNSTFMFALVTNVERIKIAFDNRMYLITREELQAWYGKELGQFSNEQDLRKLTQDYIQDKNKLSQFMLKQT